MENIKRKVDVALSALIPSPNPAEEAKISGAVIGGGSSHPLEGRRSRPKIQKGEKG